MTIGENLSIMYEGKIIAKSSDVEFTFDTSHPTIDKTEPFVPRKERRRLERIKKKLSKK